MEHQNTPLTTAGKRSTGRPAFFSIGGVLLFLAVIAGVLAYISAASPIPASLTIPETNKPIDSSIALPPTIAEYVMQHNGLQPPCDRSTGEPVQLINNPEAGDVSYEALCAFISQDKTDREPYVDDRRKCADFAETVHNNAEKYGIRAAWAGILFEDREAGHAINAFQTIDRGLIYIDCTGTKKYEACAGADHIAYIEKGREYGCIDINFASSPDYSFYTTYQQTVNQFQTQLSHYNSDVEAYNSALGGRTALADPEYSKFRSWALRLEQQKSSLKELSDKIGRCFVIESMGIVKKVDLYW